MANSVQSKRSRGAESFRWDRRLSRRYRLCATDLGAREPQTWCSVPVMCPHTAAQGLSTHWENSAVLRERMERLDIDNAIASQQGQVVTCAGMRTTLDVVLSVIGRHISSAELMTVANIFLHERIRDFGTRQPFGGAEGTATGDADLDKAIGLMQANIEEPLPIGELVDLLQISNRSLERKFRTYLKTTPNTYYRQLRLAQANNLLLNTTLSVREVGLACGFAGGFSVLYKSFFGLTPLEMRRRRRRGESPEQRAASGQG